MLVDVIHYHHLQNNHYSNSLHTCIQKEKPAFYSCNKDGTTALGNYFRHFQSPIFRSYRYVKSHQKNSHPNSCNLHVDFSPCKRKYSEKIIFKHQHICLVKISMKKTASEFTSFGEKIEKL